MNWLREHYVQIRNTVIGAVMVGLLVMGWYAYMKYQERRALEAQRAVEESMDAEAAAQEAGSGSLAEDGSGEGAQNSLTGLGKQLYDNGLEQRKQLISHEDGTVEYQGVTYRRNSYTKAILCMGVDRSDELVGTREFGKAGQADGLFLIAQDTARGSLKILMIPRDSMAEMDDTDNYGNPVGRDVTHLTLAFGFGDGYEQSCQNMVQVTQDALCGLTIDSYFASDVAVISVLNDAVGGVTVTIPTEGMEKKDPAFVKGNQVTLHGSQAETFVRYRDINEDNSALYRMDRHQEYISRFFRAVQAKSREDSSIVTHLFDLMQNYMITDMDKAEYLKIAVDALQSGGLEKEDFYTLPGMGITTDYFDEYYINYSQAIPIILELFYHEVS